jgi:hypothetical protein
LAEVINDEYTPDDDRLEAKECIDIILATISSTEWSEISYQDQLKIKTAIIFGNDNV